MAPPRWICAPLLSPSDVFVSKIDVSSITTGIYCRQFTDAELSALRWAVARAINVLDRVALVP